MTDREQEDTLITIYHTLKNELNTTHEREDIIECMERLVQDFPTIDFS